MGKVLSGLLTNPGYQKADFALKSASAKPNMVFWIEHVNYAKGGRLCRHVIYKSSGGGLDVVKLETGFLDINRKVWDTSLGSYTQMHDAKRAIEKRVSVLEQDGWDYLDEKSLERYDIVHVQKIPPGLRFFVALDPYGNIWIKPSCAKGQMLWVPATNCIKNMIGFVANVDESRGAVLEVLLDGACVRVLDIWYLHDAWLMNMDPIKRHAFIESYMKKHKVICKFIGMKRVRGSASYTLISGEHNAVLAEIKGLRYLVTNRSRQVFVSGSFKGEYSITDEETFNSLGSLDGRYLPDISYLTFNAAGEGLNAFWY